MVPEVWSATERICHFGVSFPHLPPPNNPKSQNFEKMKKKKKKKPGESIILHICTINDGHMICGS